MTQFLILFISLLSLNLFASGSHDTSRPDLHAPISVMGDHVHKKGEFMWSYRYMSMSMDGVLNATSDISYETYNSETSYMSYLDSMTMTMHMLGGMYAQSDKLTWMLMLPYLNNDMVVKAKMGGALSSMNSAGIGDLKFSGLYSVLDEVSVKAHFNFGVSLPTGAIDATSGSMTVGYPMQLGSGTFDIRPSFTLIRFFNHVSFGSQFNATIRTGENDQGYRLGNLFNHKVWFSRSFDRFSLSSSLIYDQVLEITGEHSGIMSVMNAAQDAVNSGYSQLTATIGVNVSLANGYRVAAEYLLPVYQDVTGYQMNKSGSVVFGVQKAY